MTFKILPQYNPPFRVAVTQDCQSFVGRGQTSPIEIVILTSFLINAMQGRKAGGVNPNDMKCRPVGCCLIEFHSLIGHIKVCLVVDHIKNGIATRGRLHGKTTKSLKLFTTHKGEIVDSFQRRRQCDFLQGRTPSESGVRNFGYILWNSDTIQRLAVHESIRTDAVDLIG